MYWSRLRLPLATLAGLLLLWLAGLLMLCREVAGEAGLKLAWQRSLGEGYHWLGQGTRGGIYLQTIRDGNVRLRMLEPDGRERWEVPVELSFYWRDVEELDGMLCIHGQDGRVLALDYDGNTLWDFRPDFDGLEGLVPGPDSPEAELYSRCGVLVFGLDLQGRCCWAVNTAQEKIFSFMHPVVNWHDRQVYIINDSRSVRLLHPDGSIELIDFNELDPNSGSSALSRMRLKLEARIGDRLLLVDEHNSLLLGDDGTVWLDSAVDHYWARNAVEAGAGKLMAPFSRQLLGEFDGQGKLLATIDLDGNLNRSMAVGDGVYAMLLDGDDGLARGLLELASRYPVFEKGLLLACYGNTRGTIRSPGLRTSLQLVRDGRTAGDVELGQRNLDNEYPMMATDGSRLYLLFNQSVLHCYEPGAAE